MIRCINSNIEIYSENDYDTNNWNLINNDGVFNILNNYANSIDFCILQNGNIGIGSSVPQCPLDIIGDVSILGTTTINSKIIINNVDNTYPIAQYGTNTNVANNIYIYGGSVARIGVGSATPTAAIDIIGSANVSGIINAKGGLIVSYGYTLVADGGISTASISASGLLNAAGGIEVPAGRLVNARGGISATTIIASGLINANGGITLPSGRLLTANGGISATFINASDVINANGGLIVPVGRSLTANGGISASSADIVGTINASIVNSSSMINITSANATTPIAQFGANGNPVNNLYFVGGGVARIGIGSATPTASLDIIGDAKISGLINANGGISATTITASGIINASVGLTATTITASGLITANNGIVVPAGKIIDARGGLSSTTINATGMINADGGLTATTIRTYGIINADGGLKSTTIEATGLITAANGISATTLSTSGLLNANAGLSASTIEARGTLTANGSLISKSIIASELITANNGISATFIDTSNILARSGVSTTPIAQFGTNANAASNLYFVGGGVARIGIGSATPTASLDIVGSAKISGVISANGGISATTISASGLITANNGISANTMTITDNILVNSAVATIPIAQVGNNTNATSNLYFVGGGRSRIGIGSSSPNVALDIIGYSK